MNDTTLSASIKKYNTADDPEKMRDVLLEQFPQIFNRNLIEITTQQVPQLKKIPKIFDPKLKSPMKKHKKLLYVPS